MLTAMPPADSPKIVTREASQKYARACNDDNPRDFDETGGGIVAPPMFGVVVTWMSIVEAIADPQLGADILRLLHSEQDMEFIAPLRPGDEISTVARVASIEARHGGEAMVLHTDQRYVDFWTPKPVVANIAWMLDAFSEENGGTRLIPSSHRRHRHRHRPKGTRAPGPCAGEGGALNRPSRACRARQTPRSAAPPGVETPGSANEAG